MVMSMTGFGRAKKDGNQFSVTIEVKSVNHRFSETNLRMPRQFAVIEDKIKKVINQYIQRGRVELLLTIEGDELVQRSLQVNWDLMDQYFSTLSEAKKKYSLQDQVTLSELFKLDQIVSIVEVEKENEPIYDLVIDVVHLAMEQLVEMRKAEGKELHRVLLSYLLEIQEQVQSISSLAPFVIEQYRERVSKRVNEYVTGLVDENKILTEVAIFSEKADISEELARMNSHVSQFINTMESQSTVGRKLDFLLQEMNRETNTIGSKANDKLIAQHVVEIKSLIEKIKEQVQNIE